MTTMIRRLLAGGAAIALTAAASPSLAQARSFNIPAQPAVDAIPAFARQAGVQIIVPSSNLRGLRTPALSGAQDSRQALRRLIADTGLEVASDSGATIVLRVAQRPSVSAARRPARPAEQAAPVTPRRRPSSPPVAVEAEPQATVVQDIVVTARRMEERIIDVPVAVSAFTGEQLEDRKVEGGAELLRIVPNVNFSKDNFTGYNFSIRGIGTKAISVTTDPGVAVSFNNTALLRNRLFEQEYFDMERLEVLRGPQGTLYGRNATAGVVNMLPKLPELEQFSMSAQGELGNFEARRARGHINIPLGDQFAFRAAAAYTQREGYDENLVTGRAVNGRDLWSSRLSLLWKPNERFSANLLWEHFEEDDNRSRTGKQLCTRGESPSTLSWQDPSGAARTTAITANSWAGTSLTPGCQAKSLYSDEAFGAPNGIGFPIVTGMILVTPFDDSSTLPGTSRTGPRGAWGNYLFQTNIDPFSPVSGKQSTDLREIETYFDPVFRAKNDVVQLNLELDLTDGLTLYSQTLYMEDSYYGMQDYFRINPQAGLIACREGRRLKRNPWQTVSPYEQYLGACEARTTTDRTAIAYYGNGVFNDPQLGPLDRLVAVDLSQSASKQWSQEFRLSSAFDGPVNFNLGANYLKFKTEEDYYVFSNAFTIAAMGQNGMDWSGTCQWIGNPAQAATADPNACTYIDPNPIGKLDGQGHNYYRNMNIASTESWAVFGEGYFVLREDLRLTAGLRYTEDKKTTAPIPTQLLGSSNIWLGNGGVGKGYPRYPDEVRRWNEWTGRLAVDWKPVLPFTDDTLVYVSLSRGYKGGGANPRGPEDTSATKYPRLPTDFAAEYINAFEVGTKNALLGGKMMLNASAFYYDYKDYQVTQVIDRTLHNENFDAKIYGLEFEAAWAPTRNFRLDATLGLLRTRIADGEKSIDIMNRTQGNADWITLRPWPTSPATCIVPKDILARAIGSGVGNSVFLKALCPGPELSAGMFRDDPRNWVADQWGPVIYDPVTYVNPRTGTHDTNGGRGFSADLSGNSLPNAPEMTFNIGAQYRIALPAGWDLMLRGDYYRQSESFMRVYNTEFDKLKSWENANLSANLSNQKERLTVQIYVKNVFDKVPLTDGFTGPDEIGNTTNVFTLDPRLIGVSVRKEF